MILNLKELNPKPDRGTRLILNLKELHTYVKYFHFKMETIKTVLQNIIEDCFMTSFDLKDAYFSVKIYKANQKYLRFRWKNILYEFICYPHGLGPCPGRFTKLIRSLCLSSG